MTFRRCFNAIISASLVVASAAALARADDAFVAKAPPTTAPTITPAAQILLDQIRGAYANIESMEVRGTISSRMDIDGRRKDTSQEFTGQFQAPNRFHHVTTDDLLYGGTGDQGYIYMPDKKIYMLADVPKERTRLADWPGTDLPQNLHETDLPLALALSANAAEELLADVVKVDKTSDVVIDRKPYPAILLTQELMDVTLAIDPQTHLVRQLGVDLTRLAKSRGAEIVKSAVLLFDYASTTVNPPLKDDVFAWSPPAEAQEYHAQADSNALVGNPAPTFKLQGLDDKTVSSADLKGSVYVLDFWATWCGPCRASLPEIDNLYKDNQSAGLKVFAVNQGESKDVVKKFVDDTRLSVPVLLDGDQSVGGAYGANAIPETVVVGRDGKVRKVFVGSGQGEQIRAEVAAALKGGQ